MKFGSPFFIILCLTVRYKYKSSFTTLGLFDVIQITVAINSKSKEHHDKIAITSVVKIVGLVPVWEMADILMGDWSLITRLEVT